jgi:Lipase (class 3)
MDPAEALTLAAITYRGCEFNLSNPDARSVMRDEIAKCLQTFSKVEGQWELVWGPAGYCSTGNGLDDSAMYVVRRKGDSSTLAIVIRGTNFFSIRDWQSNLLIDPKPWAYGSAVGDHVRISHSVWLGLNILQTLRSENLPPATVPITPVEKAKSAATLAKAQATIKPVARAGYAFLKGMLDGHSSFDIKEVFSDITKKIVTLKVAHLFGKDNDDALLEDVNAAHSSGSGETLSEFLKRTLSNLARPVNISVIGHSKGGALAPALALWLADTQGTDQWDPESKATLHPYSFAGPTAGNAGFATRFINKFPNAYRLANPRDIVTHAWDPVEVRQISGLYDAQLEILTIPAQALAVLIEGLGYQHEVGAVLWAPDPLTIGSLPEHIAFNHLDAYLEKLGIPDAGLRILEVFKPI